MKDRPNDKDVLPEDGDDFYDLPPYEPSASAPRPTAARPASRRFRALGIRMGVFGAALMLAAAVIWIAHATALPDVPTPPSTGEQTDVPVPSVPQDTPAEPDHAPDAPDLPAEPDTDVYLYAADVSAHMGAIEYAPQKSDILLLNKQNAKGVNFAPATLAELDTADTLYGKEVFLESTTASALQAMLLCMRADGITDTFVTSGYRSYTYQAQLFALYVQQEMHADPSLSRNEATAIVERYSSPPGFSEHQSGLCVDLMTTTMGSLDRSFEDTEAFAWLQDNAARFGFILRYPEDAEHITGYTYEPWHYRFVGKAAAMEITAAGITLEEYLGQIPQ